ncbi:DUF4131 domain-containing protein [Alphaproteobacteria bacterium GH1-50]|uniref:DUF4131 domain-containing protein n=1 Tax=Kangsaoukella pontilimi TaxID=2691042 RepID=A0A7C9MBJ9_9RHOB|nr:ComEC/Rec2 family competence protein [Kangsaoukella pontilimi]MXQ06871.1 DUF4131 domain-containing protein [Kangsaoukella pontilimi]
MPRLQRLIQTFDTHRGTLFPWVAVLYGAGIGLYFALPFEPAPAEWLMAGALTAFAGVLSAVLGPVWRPLTLCLLIPALGFLIAGTRTSAVADNVLTFRYYGPVEGRVVAIDRSQSDAVRLTLDRVRLRDVPPERTPGRVRVALHGQDGLPRPGPGTTVVLTGHLSPPGGPVEPGGYDFRRHAWYLGLGAVGYTRSPALEFLAAEPGALRILRLRMAMADRVRADLPGRAGAFAAAITTGDRSALDEATLENLRATNLAHLLAISGLHMGLLTGFVFAALRISMALVPGLALRRPTKKIAAVAALMSGAAYLAISGNNVATERAFIMVAVMFLAVLADRQAVSMRSVALAALVVLTLRPETLLGPGFQMSFAATTALVAVYGWMRERDWSESRWPKAVRYAGGVALSSAVAGIATAPIAAAHFNQVPHYGLLANLLSVPLMGLVIMPAAVLAAVLWPLGLSVLGLKLMEPGILWILAVSDRIADWPGALSQVWAPGPWVLPLIALGGAMVAGLKGRLRAAAAMPLGAALVLWSLAERPDILVAESGGQVGVLTAEGRAVSRPRGDGFAVSNWLENDGDGAAQDAAAARGGWRLEGRVRVYDTGSLRLLHGTGKAGAKEALARCAEGVVIVNQPVDAPPGCVVHDPKSLARSGAVAVFFDESGAPRIETARGQGPGRPWSQ